MNPFILLAGQELDIKQLNRRGSSQESSSFTYRIHIPTVSGIDSLFGCKESRCGLVQCTIQFLFPSKFSSHLVCRFADDSK